MTTLLEGESGLDAALVRWAATARRVGPWRWRFPLADPWLPGASVDAAGGWLCFELPLDGSWRAGRSWSLLCANGRLPGIVKAALAPDGAAVLRAETPVDEDFDWSAACHDLLEDLSHSRVALDRGMTGRDATLAEAATEVADGNETPAPERGDSASVNASIRPEAIAALCLERGWPAVTRTSGTVIVDLQSPAGFRQASIRRSRGGAHVAVDVLSPTSLSPVSRDALATLLLTACRHIRLARAAADDGAEGDAIRFEVCFDRAPHASALDHALSALDAACRFCAREAAMLADEHAARTYLDVHGGHVASERRSPGDPEPDSITLHSHIHHRAPSGQGGVS